MSDYQHTLNLPETEFPMRGNLAQREPAMLKQWTEKGLYHKIRAAKQGNTPFVLHESPHYANSDIHIGHEVDSLWLDINKAEGEKCVRCVENFDGEGESHQYA